MLKATILGSLVVMPFIYMMVFHLMVLLYVVNVICALLLAFMVGKVMLSLWQD